LCFQLQQFIDVDGKKHKSIDDKKPDDGKTPTDDKKPAETETHIDDKKPAERKTHADGKKPTEVKTLIDGKKPKRNWRESRQDEDFSLGVSS
jgi:hypothetical protein